MGLCDSSLPTPELHSIQFPLPISLIFCGRFTLDNRPNSKTNYWRCLSGGRSGGSRWDSEKNVNPKHKSRFRMDDYGEGTEFEFRNVAKQRIWWYDDFDADADDDDDEEEENWFGILETSIGLDWVSKVFQAFGWMIPAVVIYTVTGMGPNSIIMALALPLAQSAFSLATETFFGRPEKSLRPKSKRKKKPFAGASSRARVRREKQMYNEKVKEAGNYKSWVDANNLSDQNAKGDLQNFGGWDELDSHARVEKKVRNPNGAGAGARTEFKKSKRAEGDADTPLLMRLLAAIFPYLRFWTKLF
ncbi:uncharacterized protein LOC127257742 [Andrographis paniculata]|uniref:uncharacterized protein LOC127257742 n=1 Tax=Andrographis paniculata TaxID=175694 RepID=UPI0021E7F4F6|nr:uncharacterized protein LOC127257742 [Andrographis paniculata]XP_051140164.1 uncharacterized protein LOC127257742 [Andrographis paniculata]